MTSASDASSPDPAGAEAALRAYLRGALALQGLALPAEAVARIEEQFIRIAAIAAVIDRESLAADDEPAFQFRA